MSERIGFVGVGAMGRPMSTRLLAAGYALSIYARRPEAAQPLAALGARVCASPREVAEASDIVCVMVTTTADVEAVVTGDAGIAQGAAPGSLVIVMSTISPLATQALAATLAERGIDMLDAPVSGGPDGAANGTLAIMAGGSTAAFERARPVLERLGRSIVHVGPAGSGQIAKACNQLALCVALEGVAEALALAERLGADPARVREVMLNGLASSRALDVFGGRMVARDFTAGVEARLHHKDMQIVLELAHRVGLSVPAAAATTQMFNALIGAGGGRKDSAALLAVLQARGVLD